MTVAGIICIIAGVFAFATGLLKKTVRSQWYRWRLLIGGPVAVMIGILVLTGIIGG
jgi:uncharacterized membrane protein HdeD (DUF308 family)